MASPLRLEMDWNVVMIVTPYEMTLHPTDQNDPPQPRITWTAPTPADLANWPDPLD